VREQMQGLNTALQQYEKIASMIHNLSGARPLVGARPGAEAGGHGGQEEGERGGYLS
jgi:hypothetical protein